ncbi:Ig-like domain-containing protein, partial [Pseudomonas sp. NPDC087346]|uniref:Ig-like domain-containing protein n=1 Tax=Pseudomonas sp. NPDC087346 TaxID=3364438 RepID=UPI00380C56E6
MRIEIVTTNSNGLKEKVNVQAVSGHPIKTKAVPGTHTVISVDGVKLSGAEHINGKKPELKKEGNDLLIQVDGETIVEINDFYVSKGATLDGTGWSYASGTDALPVDAAEHSVSALDEAGQMSDAVSATHSNALYYGAAALLGVGGIALAAGGGGGGGHHSSTGSTGGGGTGTPVAETTIVNGQVVAGPLVAGHGLSVTLYSADGTILAGPVVINNDGTFTLSYSASHTGAVLARVTDTNAGGDYLDEATRTAKDLAYDLRAAFVSNGAGTVTIVLSPLTELAVRALGLPAGTVGVDGSSSTTLGALSAEQIQAANTNLATRLGMGSDLFVAPVPVVDAQGHPNASANLAGYILAAISGFEELHGAAAAQRYLTEALSSTNNELEALLIAGASQAGNLQGVDYLTPLTVAVPAAASAMSQAQAISNTQLSAMTESELSALSPSVVAALTPAQIAMLAVGITSALTNDQLHALNSAQLAQFAQNSTLSLAQAQQLSEVQLDALFHTATLSFTVTDDVQGAIGPVAAHALINDATPTLSGTLAVVLPTGALVSIYDGSEKIGTATLAADRRSWSFTPASPWLDGAHALSVSIEIPSGASTVQAGKIEFSIETVLPTISITGPVAGEDVVNAAEAHEGVRVSGTTTGAENGQLVSVKWGTSTVTATVSNGAWSALFTEAQVPADSSNVPITASVSSLAGNVAVPAEHSMSVDSLAPTLVITSDKTLLLAGESATFTFTFSEAPTGFTASDVTVANGVLTDLVVTSDPKVYTAKFVPTANVDSGNQASVVAGGYTDAAGNPGSAGLMVTIAIDTTVPTVSSVEMTASTGAVNSTLNAGDTASVTVAFSEVVTVTGTPTINLTVGSSTKTATYVSGSGTVNLVFSYTVAAGDTDANGLALPANGLAVASGSIKDGAGNNATLSYTAVADNASYLVDTTAPAFSGVVISGVDSADVAKTGTLVAGDKIKVTLTASEAVTVNGIPTYTIDVGGVSKTATYVSGSGTNTLVFTYTVAAGDSDAAGGITATAAALALAGGGLTDAAGNTATLAVPAVAAAVNSVVVDTTAPTISSVAITAATGAANSTLNAGDTASVTVAFSEVVTVTGTPTLNLVIGSSTKPATYVSGSGTANLVFSYT